VRNRYLAKTQPPANTLVAVSSLARPQLLIEIEGVAILGTIVRH
jgi:enamine deaminase RidA (YjgF/YER057c/UK114 family)